MQIDRQQNEMVIVTIMVGIICGVFGESIVSTQVTPTIPQAYFHDKKHRMQFGCGLRRLDLENVTYYEENVSIVINKRSEWNHERWK